MTPSSQISEIWLKAELLGVSTRRGDQIGFIVVLNYFANDVTVRSPQRSKEASTADPQFHWCAFLRDWV